MKWLRRPTDPFANRDPQGRPATLSPFARPREPARPPTMPANAVRPTVLAHQPKPGESALEARHPDIAQAVVLMWGHPELNAYMDRIYLASGPQAPVHPEAMADLMLLARIHRELKPQQPPVPAPVAQRQTFAAGKSTDLWGDVTSSRRG
jgi:hypothetical protein